MKRIIFLILVVGFYTNVKACDCSMQTFKTNYLNNRNNSEVVFIKGLKLKTHHHGMQVKVLEVLKGILQEDTIIVWGNNGATCRIDPFELYNDNDTLCMLITKTDLAGNILIPSGIDYEDSTDYMTITCSFSVVLFSNGYITGQINSIEENNTMLLSDFYDQLSSSTNTKLEEKSLFYPNPVDFQLSVNLDQEVALPLHVEIYTHSGQLIQTLNYNQSQFTINTDLLNSGMYIIAITDKNKNKLSRKFIKL